jgi:hypothetical protein
MNVAQETKRACKMTASVSKVVLFSLYLRLIMTRDAYYFRSANLFCKLAPIDYQLVSKQYGT